MKCHKYTLIPPREFRTQIRGRGFENRWIKIDKEGRLTVKHGYSWNGCNPKINILDLWIIGTPDGIIDHNTGHPKTYDASLIHDALMQFRKELVISVEQCNKEFEVQLRKAEFKLTGLYVFVLRVFWKAHTLILGE